MNKTNQLSTAIAIIVCSAISAQAASVCYVGSVMNNAGNEVTNWKTTTVAKSFDADGDGEYGTMAHIFYTVEFKGNGDKVGYIAANTQLAPSTLYTLVDDPRYGPYTSSPHAMLNLPTTTSPVLDPNVLRDMAHFSVLTNSTPNFRMGVMTDGLNGAQYSPIAIGVRLTDSAGVTISNDIHYAPTNNTVDMHFFDIYGAQAGDRLMVYGITSNQGVATHSVVTWDVIVPEPATGSLLAMGAMGLGLLARRRRRQANALMMA